MKKSSSSIVVAEPWETTNNPVLNTNHQYLHFLNTAVFSESARHFLKHGYYTSAPYGSKDWIDYWDREEERCTNGYSVGGVRVTGRHYFFLNYSLLKARPIDPATGLEKDAKKIITFPRFLDHQYYLFHEIEECFAEGPYKGNNLMGMIIAKSRRKGISFVNSGGIITYNYNFVPSSLTTIAAYEAVHYNTLLNGTHYVLNHLNKNTDWAKRRQRINRRDHFRASFVYTDDAGIEVEDGFMSEVQAKSFKDDPFKAIGDSVYTMCFEEAGRFKGLLDAYTIAEPTFRDGDIMTGIPMVWGCVCAGTKIYDNSGREVLVEKLKKENGILGYEGSGIVKQPIIWKQPTTSKPCYRITTSGNKMLECSNDHPLLWSKLHFEKVTVKNKVKTVRKKVTFKCAEDIKVGDQLMVCRQIPVFGVKQMWEPRLIGLLIGDGNYSYNATPQLSIADSEIFEWMERSNLRIKIYKEFELKTGGTFKSVGIKAIHHELKELGIFGQSGNNKHLPKNIDDYDQYSLSELLGGYFDADGNVCENKKKNVIRIILTSKSNLLLEEVKHVLTKFSISCSIRKETRKTGYLPGNVYRLYISKHEDVRQFKKHIKFLCNRKQELLDKVSDTKSDMIYNNCYFEQSPSNKKGNYYLEHNNLSNLEAVVVKKVEFIGNQLVYNFNAGITHTYITNGFISGNTGGDVEAGGKDLEEMFYNPSAYGLKAYQNIYDENAVGNCGWFIDDLWYMPGVSKDSKHVLVDEHGNSYRELSEEILDAKRTVRASGSRAAYRKFVTQQPKSPKEAFLRIDSSPFDTLRAQSRLTDILTDQKTYISSIYTARFTVSPEGVIKYEYDATSVPLREFPIKDWNNVAGCPEIYEHPIKNQEGNITPLRYIAGIDSYDADKSTTDSVGSMLVLDRLTDRIVCHYKGRPSANTFYETCRRILKYYNATANYERANKGIYGYFYNMRCLHLLCDEPEILKEKGISKANTIGNNLKGTAPSLPVNAWGRELAALWSESPAYGEDAESEIVNMNKIRSLGLLREILSYNDTGNFDDISALGMLMIYRENLMMTKVRKESKTKSIMNDVFWKRHTTQRQLFTQR